MVETKGPTGPPHGSAPSLWPLGFAIGLTVALVGLVIGSWSAVAVGAVLMVGFGFVWVRDAMTGGESPAVVAARQPAAVAVVDEEELETYGRGTFLGLTTLGLGGVITGLVAASGRRLRGPARVRGPGNGRHRHRPDRRLPGGRIRGRDVPQRPGAGRGVAPHRVRAQQRAQGRPAELHDPLEPLRPPRLPGSGQRPFARGPEAAGRRWKADRRSS